MSGEVGELTGTVLAGSWRVGVLIGKGGMADVYAGVHDRNGLAVAIKVMRAEFAEHGDQRQRFAREGYVANKIQHPGVVHVIDDGVEGEHAFIVMELLIGNTLRQEWRSAGRRLSIGRLIEVVDAILQILIVAHQAGVVHRDLKPENVFVMTDGTVRLMDFGLARLREGPDAPRTVTGLPMGTPPFMPPEQAAGKWSEVDTRADIFALGASIWQLLTGTVIHEASGTGALLVAAATQPVPAIRTVFPAMPAPLAMVIDRALAFDKADRWPSAEAMLNAWRAAAAGGDPVLDAPTERMSRAELMAFMPKDGETTRMKRSSVGASALTPVPQTVPATQRMQPDAGWSTGVWLGLIVCVTLIAAACAWGIWFVLQ